MRAAKLIRWVGTLVCLWVVGSLSTPAQAVESSYKALLVSATEARDAGRLEEALTHLSMAYEQEPQPLLMNNIGRLNEELGRYRAALKAYQSVVDDPAADAQLRALDAGRVASLRSLMGRAWVRPQGLAEGAQLLVDGRPPNAPQGEDFSVTPGDHTFEIHSADARAITVLRRSFPLDRRTDWSIALTGSAADMGIVSIASLAVRTLDIDGYTVQSPLSGVQTIHLVAGETIWRATLVNNAERSGRATVRPGESLAFDAGFTDLRTPTDGPSIPAVVPPIGGGLGEGAADEADSGLSAGPYILLGAGVLALGTGIALHVLGQDDIRTVNAATDGSGTVTGLTYREASVLSQRGEERQAGGVGLWALGAAATTAGVIWAVVDALDGGDSAGAVDSSGARVQVSPTLGGVSLRGQF